MVMERRRAIIAGQDQFVPPGYMKCDYIAMPGYNAGSNIDTGVPGGNVNLKMKCEARLMAYTQYSFALFGNAGAENSRSWRLIMGSSNNGSLVFSTPARRQGYSTLIGIPGVTTAVGARFEFETGYGWARVTRNGQSNYATQVETTESISTTNIAIGANKVQNSSESDIYNKHMFYFKIYDNDILIRNYVPVIRKSDNVAGFYDTVKHTFNIPSTGSPFLAGYET